MHDSEKGFLAAGYDVSQEINDRTYNEQYLGGDEYWSETADMCKKEIAQQVAEENTCNNDKCYNFQYRLIGKVIVHQKCAFSECKTEQEEGEKGIIVYHPSLEYVRIAELPY